jgi:hypothetical protein
MHARVPPVVRQHPPPAYVLLAFGISWAADPWVVAPTGIPAAAWAAGVPGHATRSLVVGTDAMVTPGRRDGGLP